MKLELVHKAFQVSFFAFFAIKDQIAGFIFHIQKEFNSNSKKTIKNIELKANHKNDTLSDKTHNRIILFSLKNFLISFIQNIW